MTTFEQLTEPIKHGEDTPDNWGIVADFLEDQGDPRAFWFRWYRLAWMNIPDLVLHGRPCGSRKVLYESLADAVKRSQAERALPIHSLRRYMWALLALRFCPLKWSMDTWLDPTNSRSVPLADCRTPCSILIDNGDGCRLALELLREMPLCVGDQFDPRWPAYMQRLLDEIHRRLESLDRSIPVAIHQANSGYGVAHAMLAYLEVYAGDPIDEPFIRWEQISQDMGQAAYVLMPDQDYIDEAWNRQQAGQQWHEPHDPQLVVYRWLTSLLHAVIEAGPDT